MRPGLSPRIVCPLCQRRHTLGPSLEKKIAHFEANCLKSLNLLSFILSEKKHFDTFDSLFLTCKCGLTFDLRDSMDFSPFFSPPYILPYLQEGLKALLFSYKKNKETPPSSFEKRVPRDVRAQRLLWTLIGWKRKVHQNPAYNSFIKEIRGGKSANPLKVFATYFIRSDEFNGLIEELWGDIKQDLLKIIRAHSDASIFFPETLNRSRDPADLEVIQNFFIYLVHTNKQDLQLDYFRSETQSLEMSAANARLNYLERLTSFNELMDRNEKFTQFSKQIQTVRNSWKEYYKIQKRFIISLFRTETIELLSESAFYKEDGLLGRPSLDPGTADLKKFPISKGLFMNLSNLIRKFIIQEFVSPAFDQHLEIEKTTNLFGIEIMPKALKKCEDNCDQLFFWNRHFSPIMKRDPYQHLLFKKMCHFLTNRITTTGSFNRLQDLGDLFTIIFSKLFQTLNAKDNSGSLLFANSIESLRHDECFKKNLALDATMQQANMAEVHYDFDRYKSWMRGINYFKPLSLASNYSFSNSFWLWGLFDFFFKHHELFNKSIYEETLKKFMIKRKVIEVAFLINPTAGQIEENWKQIADYLEQCNKVLEKENNPIYKSLLELALIYHPAERILLNTSREYVETIAIENRDPWEFRGAECLGRPHTNRYSLYFFTGFIFLKLRDYKRARKVFLSLKNALHDDRNDQNTRDHALLHEILFELSRGFQTAPNLYLNFSEDEIFLHTQRVLKKNYFSNYRYD